MAVKKFRLAHSADDVFRDTFVKCLSNPISHYATPLNAAILPFDVSHQVCHFCCPLMHHLIASSDAIFGKWYNILESLAKV